MRRTNSKNPLRMVSALIALVLICCGCMQQASESAHMVTIRSMFGADLPEVAAALSYSEADFSYSEEIGSYVLTAPVEVLERNATLQLHFLERREGKMLRGATFEILSSAAPTDGASDAIRFCNRLKEIYAEPYQGLVKSENTPELGSIDQQSLTKIFSENGTISTMWKLKQDSPNTCLLQLVASYNGVSEEKGQICYQLIYFLD